jgi:hypothetical protein
VLTCKPRNHVASTLLAIHQHAIELLARGRYEDPLPA